MRRAVHAGSWYSSDPKKLNQEMDRWLNDVNIDAPKQPIRAVIGPHAGYTYSGKTASHAYKHIDAQSYKRVVMMGPSHRKYIPGIALCRTNWIETPLGNLQVDLEAMEILGQAAKYFAIKKSEDEEEHSLEMHFPWVAKVFKNRLNDIKIIPMIVGDIDEASSKAYALSLLPFLRDPQTLFVISSDFCHWGRRFEYTYYDKSFGPIFKSIEAIDRLGMEKISTLEPSEFKSYLKRYHNTICGRNPIFILLHMITQLNGPKFEIQWVHYSQSSQVVDPDDSSVSYASGILLQEMD